MNGWRVWGSSGRENRSRFCSVEWGVKLWGFRDELFMGLFSSGWFSFFFSFFFFAELGSSRPDLKEQAPGKGVLLALA